MFIGLYRVRESSPSHYFYRLKGEHAIPSTPRRWWRTGSGEDKNHSSELETPISPSQGANKRLILSQQMIIDVDPGRRSEQAEVGITISKEALDEYV